jgi:hypothetical protein
MELADALPETPVSRTYRFGAVECAKSAEAMAEVRRVPVAFATRLLALAAG